MNSVDLAFTPALEQARLIRRKEISPLELTQLYLDRIERLNPILGSYFYVMAEEAIADAIAKTERLAQTTDDLPAFFGVPISVKDLTLVKGVPCSYGIKVAKNRIADQDAGLVTKIRDAGFVILGKTATSQLGSTPYTEPGGFPPARNPWNIDYTPGGSSGGASSAVAAGLSPVAHGSDGGGSVRGPAFCCGLVGIKPSRGRVSNAPVGDRISGIAADGTLARTVADAAALLDVMSGYITGDPYWLPAPAPSFLEATKRSPKPLKIAYTTEFPPLGKANPVCEQATLKTIHLLESLGHAIEPVTIDLSDLIEPFATVWQAGVDMGVPWFVLDKLNRWLLWRSRLRSGGVYLRAVMQMQMIARRIVTQLSAYDALVAPVFMHPTIRVGEWAKLRPVQMFNKIVNWVAPCPPFNATGQPAIAIPTGFDDRGLPIGVQIVGRPADELTLITLAAQIEAARPWSHHRPELAILGSSEG